MTTAIIYATARPQNLLPEFTLTTFAGFVDALRIAAGRYSVPNGTPVRSNCGIEITQWELSKTQRSSTTQSW